MINIYLYGVSWKLMKIFIVAQRCHKLFAIYSFVKTHQQMEAQEDLVFFRLVSPFLNASDYNSESKWWL